MQAPWAKGGAGTARPGPPERRDDGGEKPAAPSSFSIKGWTFEGENRPILSTHETDRWTKDLEMTLPEMVFGESHLTIRNEGLEFKYSFNAQDALKACSKEAGIKVSMSQSWMKNAEQDIPDAQPFDWTYSTPYRGAASSLPGGLPIEPTETQDRIDFESLKPRPGDEILWSADVYLFQDELHDNGDSTLQVRIRVTPNYFYVLQRLFVRVDKVIFRLKETRLHHRFGDPHALRQYTERDEDYDTVVAACTPKELRDGVLHDANALLERIPVRFDTTQKFQITPLPISPTANARPVQQPLQSEIDAQTQIAEQKFKKKFGNMRPAAGALMQRQKKHETRYFDSGDAFMKKAGVTPQDDVKPEAEEEPPQPVLSEEDRVERAASAAPVAADSGSVKVVQPSQSEIDEQTRLAEEKFKKKFGNMKPSAGALMQRQKKHETRYFDSGDAFSHKAKSERLPQAPGVDDEETPQPVLSEEDRVERVASTAPPSESGSLRIAQPVAQPSQEEIDEQTRLAEEKFKKKFGNMKPSAGALMQRQKKHETRYFDSGDAFMKKAGVTPQDDVKPEAEEEPPQPVLSEEDRVERTSSGGNAADSGSVKVVQPSQSEIDEQTRLAEEKFKKKFGNMKPSAGALMQRQKKHETRYFDSGDAFSHKAKSERLPQAPGVEPEEPPQPVLSEEDLVLRSASTVEGSKH